MNDTNTIRAEQIALQGIKDGLKERDRIAYQRGVADAIAKVKEFRDKVQLEANGIAAQTNCFYHSDRVREVRLYNELITALEASSGEKK